MTEQREPWIEEEMRREEMRQQRARWEQERRERKAQQERQAKQAELQSYLARRSRDFMDHTGEQPGREILTRWQAEYVDERERQYQAEREAKLKAAEAEYNF
jgi:hypothetical protein